MKSVSSDVVKALVVKERGKGHSERDLQLTAPITRVLKIETIPLIPGPSTKSELPPRSYKISEPS